MYLSHFPVQISTTLQAKAKMYGLNPVPLKEARVLELGASCGGNIVPQRCTILRLPFTGIDLSGVQGKTRQ